MSFGDLTCFAGYLIFHSTKTSQMMSWSAPFRRAHRDNEDGYIICYIWITYAKDMRTIKYARWHPTRSCHVQPVRLLISASPNQPANSVFLSQKTSPSQPNPAPAQTSEKTFGIHGAADFALRLAEDVWVLD